MLRNLAWQATDSLTRAQLRMVQGLAHAISLNQDEQRKALELTPAEWADWQDFLADDAALPAQPPLPEMLQRLGNVAFNLSALVDRRSVAGYGW